MFDINENFYSWKNSLVSTVVLLSDTNIGAVLNIQNLMARTPESSYSVSLQELGLRGLNRGGL